MLFFVLAKIVSPSVNKPVQLRTFSISAYSKDIKKFPLFLNEKLRYTEVSTKLAIFSCLLYFDLYFDNCLHPIVHCLQPAHLLLFTLCFIAFFTLSLTSKSKGISKYTSYGVRGRCL